VGGRGLDSFIGGSDTITDFVSGTDRIELRCGSAMVCSTVQRMSPAAVLARMKSWCCSPVT
jgi:hypothetical protein